jgi:2-methylcitrate dehydratase PrpD
MRFILGSIDADDVHVGSMLHPGCVVFSAALAVGQHLNLSGSQIFSAVVCGYEAMIRIGTAIQPSHFKRVVPKHFYLRCAGAQCCCS